MSKIFCQYSSNAGGWFRLFGKGLTWRNVKKSSPLFSERNGIIKKIYIGNYAIGWLK